MKFYFAPMEGITDWIFRNAHRACFPGLERYYTPFLSPTADGKFDRKALRDVLPERNPWAVGTEGSGLIPQLLTRRSADFLWAARLLAEMGYREVNLNVGCPSGTVTAKGKGAGMLADLDALTVFLDEIFSSSPLPISIKTRLGVKREEEFSAILERFNRFPICELLVHTRVREDLYRRPARPETFSAILACAKAPLCYNGDLSTAGAFRAFVDRFPQTPAVMLGRGLVADPALFRRCQGGPGAERETLQTFHDTLFEGYCSAFGAARSAIARMKEFWFYHICLFEGGEKLLKRLRKAVDATEYRETVRRIYGELPLREGGACPLWER